MHKKMAGMGILFFAFASYAAADDAEQIATVRECVRVGSVHAHSVRDLNNEYGVRSYDVLARSTMDLQFQDVRLVGGGAIPQGGGNSPPGGANSGGNTPPGGANSGGNTPPGGANAPPSGGYTPQGSISTPPVGVNTPPGNSPPGGAAARPPREQQPVPSK